MGIPGQGNHLERFDGEILGFFQLKFTFILKDWSENLSHE